MTGKEKGAEGMKKLCVILIIAAFLLPVLPADAFAATEDYRGWAQGDSRWDDMVWGTIRKLRWKATVVPAYL